MFPSDDQEQNYFPTDELRRRQMLSIMAPGAEDAAGEDEQPSQGPSTMSAAPQMTGAEKTYQNVMGVMPQQANYKPSVMRRIGAALAGAGTGWRNPAAGVQVAQQINQAPYQKALGAWQQQETAAAGGLKLDSQIQARQNAEIRARAALQSASARDKAAAADESYRQWQQQNTPWHPKTQEEAIAYEQSKHERQKPTAFEEYNQDPTGYAKFIQDSNKGESIDDRLQMEDRRNQGEMERTRYVQGQENYREGLRINSRKTAAPKQATPVQQDEAEQLAMRQLQRTRPEFGAFINTDKKGMLSAKGAGELPKHSPWNPFSVSAAQESLAREQHRQFLAELDKQKKQILGQQSGSSNWEIEEQ